MKKRTGSRTKAILDCIKTMKVIGLKGNERRTILDSESEKEERRRGEREKNQCGDIFLNVLES